jgi:FG-GAP-like repeat
MSDVACPATASRSSPAPVAPRVGVRRSAPGRATLAIGLMAGIAGCYHSNNPGYSAYQLVEASYGVAAADLTRDGSADVVQLSTVYPIQTPNSSNLKTYLSTGASAFAAPTLTTAGTDPLYVVAADVNLDGFADLVTASYDDGTISVFLNNAASPGSFSSPIILPSPGASQLAIADMTGDGLPDIVSADFTVSLFVQTSAGVFAAPVKLYSGGANWVAVGDLNGDGAPDVALTDATGVKLLLHTGLPADTTFAAPVSVFTQTPNANLTGANIIAIADVDGDGRNDLVITDPGPTGGMGSTVNVLRQDPNNPGTFLTAVPFPIATQDVPQSIQLVDLQRSGMRDIVIGARSTVTVLLHDPANRGMFLAATVYPASDANEIAIADVDGDGRPDIVVSNGVTQPLVNGVYTRKPGVLLQSPTTSGAFGALQDLP